MATHAIVIRLWLFFSFFFVRLFYSSFVLQHAIRARRPTLRARAQLPAMQFVTLRAVPVCVVVCFLLIFFCFLKCAIHHVKLVDPRKLTARAAMVLIFGFSATAATVCSLFDFFCVSAVFRFFCP